MMRLTRTGIGLLTAQYRSVLRKCFLINAGLFLALTPVRANADTAEDIGIPQFTRHISYNSLGQPYYDVAETSYGGVASRGGNFIKAYYNIKEDG